MKAGKERKRYINLHVPHKLSRCTEWRVLIEPWLTSHLQLSSLNLISDLGLLRLFCLIVCWFEFTIYDRHNR